jgi:hypothetical protein
MISTAEIIQQIEATAAAHRANGDPDNMEEPLRILGSHISTAVGAPPAAIQQRP